MLQLLISVAFQNPSLLTGLSQHLLQACEHYLDWCLVKKLTAWSPTTNHLTTCIQFLCLIPCFGLQLISPSLTTILVNSLSIRWSFFFVLHFSLWNLSSYLSLHHLNFRRKPLSKIVLLSNCCCKEATASTSISSNEGKIQHLDDSERIHTENTCINIFGLKLLLRVGRVAHACTLTCCF